MSFVPCTMFVLHSRDRFETKMANVPYTKCCCTLQFQIKINIFAKRDAFPAPYYAVRAKRISFRRKIGMNSISKS